MLGTNRQLHGREAMVGKQVNAAHDWFVAFRGAAYCACSFPRQVVSPAKTIVIEA